MRGAVPTAAGAERGSPSVSIQTRDDMAEALQAFARAGIDEVQLWLAPHKPAEIEAFAPVLELLDRA